MNCILNIEWGGIMLTICYHAQKDNCFLYSVNTYLAHYINETFYGGKHYVWCAPNFVAKNNPPSSNPKDIYITLKNDICRGDNHSAIILQNKLGLTRGAELMFANGKITESQRDEVLMIVNNAELEHFVPLLYVIEKNKTISRTMNINRTERANILSEETLIPDLQTDEFDVVTFECE